MMQLLSNLTQQGVEFWTDGSQLFYRGSRQVLSQTLLNRIKAEKEEIIQQLKTGGFVSKNFPLSYPQRSLWYLYQSAPESPAYNTAMAIRLLFPVNQDALRAALQTLLVRHSTLRTTFASEEVQGRMEAIQRVHAYRKADLEVANASLWSLDELRVKVKTAHEQPFDLIKGPAFRANLFLRGENDAVLLLSIHHIVCDGWSMWHLMDEFWKIYPACLELQAPVESAAPIPALLKSVYRQVKTLEQAFDFGPFAEILSKGGLERFQSLIEEMLLNALQRMGVFRTENERYHKERLKEKLKILPRYFRLYDALLELLAQNGRIIVTDQEVHICGANFGCRDWSALQAQKDELLKLTPELSAYVDLVWVCVTALPQILTGAQDYMEVMFPNGGMELVKKIYTGNLLADYYNGTVAKLVKAYLHRRCGDDPAAQVRILEVGAGTGGTSKIVLDAIREYGERFGIEYIYTDISYAFTDYGAKTLGAKYPFVRFKLLDLEQDPRSQDFAPGSIDLVIASNVLHATRRIENTLAQTKQILKKNGLLVINELTALHDFLTLTFGLTEGWWLYEDAANRLPGAPLIGLKQWRKLLGSAGFSEIKSFSLAEKGGEFQDISWQTVIVAASDGVVKSLPAQPDPDKLGLAKVSHTYEDYVRWQAEMLAGAEGERQWQYWRSKLSGELPVLNMATDHPRPAVQTFAGHWVPFRLSRELSGQLKNLAQARGLTLYTLLLTAYQILLHRYTGQEDILVGCPTTGRPQQIFDAMVGHFVNTVVVRADFANDPILEQFMEQMRQTVIEALDHQDYPFSLLVDRLNPQRDSSRPPLFQTMFVFQKPQTEFGALDVVTDFYFGEARLNIGGFEMESFPIAQQEGQFDLSIEMTGAADNLKGVLKYNQELFEAATVADMSRHFINLLQSMVAHPEQHLSELDLMDEAEQRTLLEELNDTGTDWDIQGVHRLFEEQAVRTPEAIALVFEREQMSYRELDERAGRLGGYLIQQGLQPGNPVGICVKRSLAMIVGIIAILKAGGAYVPLDPSYPKERLDFMVADARISLLLVNEHLAKRVASSNVKMIKVDQEWPLIGANRALKAERELGAASLAYILYTSGSTGKPKGVAMPHRALCNLIRWQIGNVMGPVNAKTLQYTTLNFDVSFQEIFATLAGGGTLVLFREELRYDPAALLQLMRNEAVERLFIPFVFLQMIADTVAANDNLLPSSLREIITAGEQLQITAPIRHLFEKLPQCRLCNQYGPTEAHVVTSFSLDVNPENWSFLPPIGKPIANASIYILDSHFQPVPRGVAGELYIGGLCLADGYYCRPELTETKFISKPGRNLPGRLYRTGDWARMLPDGNIQFLGRTDHQIKIRGVRIEPAEIEEQLLSYDLVSAAVVVGREEPTGGKALCAYYVSERDFAIAELKDFLAQKLPSQMIPAYFVKLAKIPLLPNQKVDRLALPQPEHTGRSEAAFMAPRDEVEAQLVKICCEVLNLDKIGVNDNLFDLGVNSLITLNIQRKIERFYSGAIRIPDLMNYPTIAGLAALIKTRESDATVIDGRAEQFRNFLDGISKED